MEVIGKKKYEGSFLKFFFSYKSFIFLCEFFLFLVFFSFVGYAVKEQINFPLAGTVGMGIIFGHLCILKRSWHSSIDIGQDGELLIKLPRRIVRLSEDSLHSFVNLDFEMASLLIYYDTGLVFKSLKVKKVLLVDLQNEEKNKILEILELKKCKVYNFSNFFLYFFKGWTH